MHTLVKVHLATRTKVTFVGLVACAFAIRIRQLAGQPGYPKFLPRPVFSISVALPVLLKSRWRCTPLLGALISGLTTLGCPFLEPMWTRRTSVVAGRIGSLALILLLTSPLAWNQEYSNAITGPSLRLSEPSISAARLRVPRNARTLYEKSIKPFRKHRYLEAQRRLDQALHLYPAFPEALTMRGYIQLELKQWESAQQSLQSAIRSDSTYGWAYLVLSHLYNMQRRFGDALDMAQRASGLMPIPDSWMVPYEICRSLMEEHQYALALNVSDAALRSNRGTMLHVAKAHALIGLGRYPEALAELRTYLFYEPAGEGSRDAHDLVDQIQNAAK